MKLPFKLRRRKSQAGFTLLETLLSFAIVSLVLAAGYTAASQLSVKQTELRQKFLATEFARAVLEEYLAEGTSLDTTGRYKDAWAWEISETPVPGFFTTSLDDQFDFLRVTSKVSILGKSQPQFVELHRVIARRSTK